MPILPKDMSNGQDGYVSHVCVSVVVVHYLADSLISRFDIECFLELMSGLNEKRGHWTFLMAS